FHHRYGFAHLEEPRSHLIAYAFCQCVRDTLPIVFEFIFVLVICCKDGHFVLAVSMIENAHRVTNPRRRSLSSQFIQDQHLCIQNRGQGELRGLRYWTIRILNFFQELRERSKQTRNAFPPHERLNHSHRKMGFPTPCGPMKSKPKETRGIGYSSTNFSTAIFAFSIERSGERMTSKFSSSQRAYRKGIFAVSSNRSARAPFTHSQRITPSTPF